VEAGDPAKPTLVLVHGLGDSASDDWLPTIERLKQDYHILAFDLPGFGRSSKGNQRYDPTRYARMIRQLAKRHISQPFHLAGHSMGGAIALRYASMYPDQVKTLALVDAAGILHRIAYSKYLAPLGLEMFSGIGLANERPVTNIAGFLLEQLERRLPISPGIILDYSLLRQQVLRGNPGSIAALGLIEEDFSRAPALVKAPTLIIWGEQDEVAPLRTGRVLNALIPDSHLHVMADTGHTPPTEEPERFVRLLRSHLQRPLRVTGIEPAIGGKSQGDVVCNGRRGVQYSGVFKSITLNNCSDITILHAELELLEVNGSSVTLGDTRIRGGDSGIRARNAAIEITNGRIEADHAITSRASRFDIAGTRITGRKAAVAAISESTFVFSLVGIDSPNWADEMIHEHRTLMPGQTL
jgi:pimeloyl-ACP methyl ester carboxylesterase